MTSESELREAMRSSANVSTSRIDTDAVVRKVRARRVPKQLALSSLSVLAIAGVAVLGVNVLPSLQPGQDAASMGSMASMSESVPDGGASDSALKSFDSSQSTRNLCGSPTSIPASNSVGLVLSVSFPDSSPANGQDVAGTVTLTNTGTSKVSGTTAVIPAITVSRDGITVWHSDGATISMVVDVDLAPGQSSTYDAYFTPVECGPQDDAEGMFRTKLPLLTAGTYQVSADMLVVLSETGDDDNILVGGPAQNIELR